MRHDTTIREGRTQRTGSSGRCGDDIAELSLAQVLVSEFLLDHAPTGFWAADGQVDDERLACGGGASSQNDESAIRDTPRYASHAAPQGYRYQVLTPARRHAAGAPTGPPLYD